jgi:hypothetical protein
MPQFCKPRPMQFANLRPPRPLLSRYFGPLLLVFALNGATAAWAQSSCSSDGQLAPTALLERFISADCESCWSDPNTVAALPGEFAIDWIVPGETGDDAPLSGVANRDALQRLEALGQRAPQDAANSRKNPSTAPLGLRVAHGLAFGGYIGTSIELTASTGGQLPDGPLAAWLVLVQAIPNGTEGSPVPRNMARNGLLTIWDKHGQLSNKEQFPNQNDAGPRLYESRPLSIPAGVNPDQLRVVGWVEDAQGQVIAAAASACVEAVKP